jgi:hypothetical protein
VVFRVDSWIFFVALDYIYAIIELALLALQVLLITWLCVLLC